MSGAGPEARPGPAPGPGPGPGPGPQAGARPGPGLRVAVSATGGLVVALAVAGIAAGFALGWTELFVVGTFALVLAIAAAVFLLGRSSGRISIAVLERNVVAGESATVAVTVVNDGERRLRSRQADFAVDGRIEPLPVPALAAGESAQVTVSVPTERRGVIRLGPVTIVRRDPLGLARRESVRSETAELSVHPRTVALSVASTGLLRDLEGIPTADLSDSDMSFHALRGYVPGDDRRHIHWRSTAKTGDFLVRQFEQTRRSHLIVMQSLAGADYASEEEFELAVSVVASIGVRAIADGSTLSVFAGAPSRGTAGRSRSGSGTEPRAGSRSRVSGGALRTRTPRELLDDLSGIQETAGSARVPALARAVGETAPDASVVFVACGSTVSARDLRAAASHFAVGVEVVAIVADPEAAAALVRIDSLRITRIGYLDDLVRTLVRAVGA